MSRGSDRVTVRLPNKLPERMAATIARRNATAHGMLWTISDFIQIAIEEKIKKMERSRKGRAAPVAKYMSL